MKALLFVALLFISSSFSSEKNATGALQVATSTPEVVVSAKKVQEVKRVKRVEKERQQAIRFVKKAQQADVRDEVQRMDSKLKIGLFLLAIGAVLSIVGIGLVGGIAALIGLCFTIIGLLHTF
jgi:hypothetical protein